VQIFTRRPLLLSDEVISFLQRHVSLHFWEHLSHNWTESLQYREHGNCFQLLFATTT